MSDKVYVVTCGHYSDYHIVRVYLSEDEAADYVNRYNAAGAYEECRVEEYGVGAPEVEYDGPAWEGLWSPPWGSPPVHPESFKVTETWVTGPKPPRAKVERESVQFVYVVGISREHVEKSLHDTVARVKAHAAGIA